MHINDCCCGVVCPAGLGREYALAFGERGAAVIGEINNTLFPAEESRVIDYQCDGVCVFAQSMISEETLKEAEGAPLPLIAWCRRYEREEEKRWPTTVCV